MKIGMVSVVIVSSISHSWRYITVLLWLFLSFLVKSPFFGYPYFFSKIIIFLMVPYSFLWLFHHFQTNPQLWPAFRADHGHHAFHGQAGARARVQRKAGDLEQAMDSPSMGSHGYWDIIIIIGIMLLNN